MKNVALITGATSGIGRELVNIHAGFGGDLVIVARNSSELERVKAEVEDSFGVEVYIISKDLSRQGAGAEVFCEVEREGIEVTYLMNNAGFGGQGYFHERDWETDLSMIGVNIVALTELTRLFLPSFIRRGFGRILNTSSTAAKMAGPMQAVYYATKAYVSSFSNAIASELEGSGVTVTALLPGATETKFAKKSGMDKTELFNRTFPASRVALIGYHAMLKGKLEALAGVTASQKAMLGLLPVIPKKFALDFIKKGQSIKPFIDEKDPSPIDIEFFDEFFD